MMPVIRPIGVSLSCRGGRAMMYRAIAVRRLLLAGVAASAGAGCAESAGYRPSFDHRVLPPPVAARQPSTRLPAGDGVKPVRADLPAADPVPVSTSPGEPAPPVTDGRCAAGPLTLPDAIALAYRLQPRLRV